MKKKGFPIQRKAKKRKTSDNYPEIRSIASKFGNLDEETIEARGNILIRKNQNDLNFNQRNTSPWEFPMDLDQLLTKRPPVNFDITRSHRLDEYSKNVETVTREYEENFMREPKGDERPCVMGQECEGLGVR